MDLAALGRFALLMALAFAAYGLASQALAIWQHDDRLSRSARGSLAGAALATTVAMGILAAAFLAGEFSIRSVAEQSSSDMPAGLTFSAIWGGQAGSLLLWAWLTSLHAGIAVPLVWRRLPAFGPYVGAVLAAVLLFFLLILVFESSPFERLVPIPTNGRGLNPLLWDLAMQIHPPLLTAGYVSFVTPFAIAIAALATGRVGTEWLAVNRPWMLLAWALQGAGLILGAWWAYRVLGWGGFWGWDPVENVALIPWLLATAYLHSAMVQERIGMLKTWNLALCLLCYVLAVFGTFVVRSGVLTSVHSFAQSLIGPYFFAWFGVLLTIALVLMIYRAPLLGSGRRFESVTSRESGFLLNNLLLASVAATTFWGTIFPLIAELVTGRQVSVGAPFYGQVNGPLLVGLVALAGVGPLLAWRATPARRFWRRAGPALAVAAVVGVVFLVSGVGRALLLVAIGACVFTVLAILFETGLAVRAGAARGLFSLGADRRRWGGYLVHLGIVLVAVGAIGTAGFQTERALTLAMDESARVGDYEITFRGIDVSSQPGVTHFVANLEVAAAGSERQLVASRRVHAGWESQPVSDVGILTDLPQLDDLYVVLAGWDESFDNVSLRVLVNPAIGWMWVGGLIFLLAVLIVFWPGAAPSLAEPGRRGRELRLEWQQGPQGPN